MPDRAALKAGIFILLMVALALGMVVAIAGTGSLFKDTQAVTVEFSPGENVANLKPDAQVRVLGVPVGRVTDVRAVPDPETGARVEVEVELPAVFELKQDASVVASASLTGDAWLDIDHLGEGEPLGGNDRLDGMTLGLSALIDQAKSLVPQAKEALARADEAATSVRDLAEAAREKVDPVTESVTNMTDRGAEVAAEARDLLGDTKTDLRTTIANVRDTTGTLKDRVPGTLDKLDGRLDDTRELMTSVKESLDRMPGILDNVEPAVADAKGFISEVRATLADNRAKVDRILTTVSRTANDASGAVSEVRAAPWRLLYKPDASEQRNLALYSVARQYARGAQDLESAARALEQAVDRTEADPESVADLRRDLVDSYERFEAVQDALWQAVRQ